MNYYSIRQAMEELIHVLTHGQAHYAGQIGEALAFVWGELQNNENGLDGYVVVEQNSQMDQLLNSFAHNAQRPNDAEDLFT